MKNFIDVNEKPSLGKAIPLSLQHLFAMFGASVLVPILFQIDPSLVLIFNGIGTLLYIFITKGKIPSYLGSSFAYLAPTFYIMQKFGYEYALGGFIASGLIFILVAVIVKYTGVEWLNKLFPAASMGAIVAIIGLELAPVAADMAGFTAKALDIKVITVSLITFITVVLGSVVFKGFLKVIPVLIGIIVGYVSAFVLGLVNFDSVLSANVFVLPHIYAPKFNPIAILTIVPATFVVLAEHIGHLVVTSNLVGRDLSKDPGLHRSLLGDGLSTTISGLFGSVPTTTYGENIGVMAITKVYSVWVIGGAAIISIILSFFGKLSALIQGIPTPVIGGVSLLLFGVIATSGFRMLVEEKVDYSKPKNLILTSVVMTIGLSGAHLNIGQVQLKGMALATIVAIVINLFFILFEKLGVMNE
ncbi:Uracil permease [Caloramator mitchellensis]|uniref:Uracil permease n=1 Tax=Caloramator mitchellensis TaxID=908809 RepID=A0A0R3JSR2_CALMK|nr:uracil permease [Caloramator mitchellensis]KRQ86545.1 Uracil permease [Caloramator mitchellensis]